MTEARRVILLARHLIVVSVFVATGASTDAKDSGNIASGRAFAQRHCATCHAIGRTRSSTYAPAPPFRTLHERYKVENLAEALAEGIVVGHTGKRPMPEFVLSPAEIDDLIAYLKSLE